jgi:tetratricopeptide (TPR) repeat protein
VTESSERKDEETIAVVRPGFERMPPKHAGTGPRARSRFPVGLVLAVLLLVLLALVFFVLPGWIDRTAGPGEAAPAPVAQAPAEPAPPPLSAEALAALKDRAESLLTQVLQQEDGLKARSAPDWAGEDWTRYEARARAGDDALLDEQYRQAVDDYDAALAQGEQLRMRMEAIIASAMDTAERALEAGNPQLATEQFDVVLGIEPENAAALAGRARAERLPEVLELTARGDAFGAERQWSEAIEAYRGALEIDPEWAPAQAALADTIGQRASAQLESLLSQGYAALADEDYDEAAKQFHAALKLRPDSKPARDGLTQAEESQKLDDLALSEARALAFERREVWDEAVARYEAALATDPTVAFAISGLERARARADLDRKLENFIDHPNLLLTDNVLEDARRLLEEARALAEPETRIADQVERLGALIEVATMPISVMLESDGQTEVTVYRVGMLGMFAVKEIQVRPGTYTAIGSRNGYRDVRTTFTVLPGREPGPINVVCTEPI